MGSVVSRKCVSEPHCCRMLTSPVSSSFRQPFFPCRLPHPFVLHSSHFSFRFCLTSNFSLYLLFSVSLFPLLIPVSSRQMAGLGVMVRCLGVFMAYRVEACIAKDIQSERIFVSLPSATSPSSPSLSLHFLKHVLSLPDVHTQSLVLGLPAGPQQFIHMCVFTDRMGFLWRATAPRVGQGTDWSLSLHVLTH